MSLFIESFFNLVLIKTFLSLICLNRLLYVDNNFFIFLIKVIKSGAGLPWLNSNMVYKL